MYRQNAEISALSSGDLNKYEYLTKKDLNYKPDPFQKAKFEYSPLGQVFNKRLKKDEKSEELLKRLKHIEDKTDNNLRAIEGPRQDSNPRSIFDRFRQRLTPERLQIFDQIIRERSLLNVYTINNFTGANNVNYDFSHFIRIGDLFRRIYNGESMIPELKENNNFFRKNMEDLKDTDQEKIVTIMP